MYKLNTYGLLKIVNLTICNKAYVLDKYLFIGSLVGTSIAIYSKYILSTEHNSVFQINKTTLSQLVDVLAFLQLKRIILQLK